MVRQLIIVHNYAFVTKDWSQSHTCVTLARPLYRANFVVGRYSALLHALMWTLPPPSWLSTRSSGELGFNFEPCPNLTRRFAKANIKPAVADRLETDDWLARAFRTNYFLVFQLMKGKSLMRRMSDRFPTVIRKLDSKQVNFHLDFNLFFVFVYIGRQNGTGERWKQWMRSCEIPDPPEKENK